MAIDFSIEPFFDDFSEDKKFHRILFRPGYAVQARELTQLQTLLQQQISRHGDHIFKEGAMVIPGQISYDLTLKYVKLEFSQNVNAEQILSTLKGNEVTNSAGLTAKIIDYALPEGDDPYTIFVRYLNTVQDSNGNNIRNYVPDDVLTPVDATLGTGLNLTVPDVGSFAGNASSATIERGVYYIKKNFVLAQQQLIILNKYDNTPTYRVGLKATESIIYPEEDENLLDNALGSPNYAAPGAARYVIDLTLTKLPLNSSTDEDFVDLLRLNNGKVIFKVDRTQYAELEKTLARRTYDESGDYALSPFGIQVKEYRNNLRGPWRAGTPFIQGDLITHIPPDSITTYYFVATTNGISGNSIPTFVVSGLVSDLIVDGGVSWEYISNPGFNQGINSFLTSDNTFANFTVNDHLRLAGMLALGVEAGKAYVRGYEIEKLATEYVTSFKSRNLPAGSNALAKYLGLAASSDNTTTIPAITDSISGYKTTNIDVSIGNYVIVNSVKYLPNITTLAEVNLYSVNLAGSLVNTNIIGKARVRAFEKHETGTYKLFLFDIRMNQGRNFTEVKSVYTTQFAFQCNLVLEDSKAVIKEPALNSLIFDLPDYAINDISNVTHTSVVSLTNTGGVPAAITGAASVSFTAPNGYTFESELDDDNYILVSNATNTAADPNILAGTILTGSFYSYSISGNGNTITISSTQSRITNISYTLFATIKRSASSNATQPRKSIVDATQTLTSTTVAQATSTIVAGGTYRIVVVGNTNFTSIGAPSNTAGVTFKATGTTTGTGTVTTSIPSEIALNNAYVTRIVSVLMDNRGFVINGTPNTSPIYNTNITNRYIFSDNQDATAIRRSSIILTGGALAPTGPIQIKYEFMNDTSVNPGGFYGVGSYSYTGSNISYEQIGTASNYSLRDSVDFRPTEEAGGYRLKYFPKFGTSISVTYNNYLSRVDNISLSSAGEFINTRGVPSSTSVEPTTPNSSMKLARINIEPYTFNRGNSVGALISRVENKRYTMRDIGKIERRVQDLEYYTALSLTELETKNMQVVDSTGLDRYQNGFLVDSFDGQGVGNAASDDWNASIDMQKKELRPFFSQRQVNLLENVNSNTKNTYRVSGDLVTLPYTEVEVAWAKQSKASVQVPVNPYSIASYKGIVSLNPWSDTWFSTHYRPDVIVNDESQYQAIVQKAEQDGILGTVWNSWQTAFSSSRSLGTRLEALAKWSQSDTSILNAQNNGGDFWRNRTTFTGEELDFIGNTNRDVGSAQATSVAGSRVLTIETSAVETTSKRSGTRSFVVDKVDSRVVEDRVVGTQIVPFIRPRAVLFVGYGFKPSTRMYSYFDNVIVDEYITPAVKLLTSPITNYSSIFDVERNAGTAVENTTRTVYYNDGAVVDGIVTLTNGSTSVTGVGSEFLSDLSVGDTVNFGGMTGPRTQYKVATIASNTVFTLDIAWQSESVSGVSIRAIGPSRTNIQEVEVAFNHGEVIKEYNASGGATGVSAIVVAQETVGTNIVLHVMNIKGGQFSNLANYSLRGEYGSVQPQVRLNSAPIVQTSLTASETGVIAGIFRIPSNPILKFRTGTREFRLSDVANTNSVIRTEQELTSGGAFYEANGIVEIKQRTIVATRTADIVSQQVSDTNTIVTTNDRLTRDTGWFDPLAQTFMVQEDGGAFITSVDLFFAARDIKIPVRIEIREVVNGYPSSRVLPFSRVEVKASKVIDTQDATGVTTFKFVSPVFLQNGTEYSLVVLSDSDYYKLWCSETGTRQVNPGGTVGAAITSQPFNGVLFKSQNASTWTADQTQDMKFTIRRAQFASASSVLELLPPKLTYASLDFNPFNFITGSGKCRVIHPNHGMKVNQKVVFKAGQVINSINGISADTIFRDAGHTILSVELDAYIVDFGTNSTSTGRVGGAFIQASENYEFQTAMIDIAEIIPPGTSISYEVTTLNHALQSSTAALVNKENLDFNEERVIPSDINNTNANVARGVKILATLNPGSSNSVSPVIDLGRLAMTTVSNKIDSPTLDIIDSTFDRFPITTPAPTEGTEIGDEASTKPIKLNAAGDTIIINALTQGTLYNNMNNNLNPGDVIEFDYTNIASGKKNMVIVDKSFNIIYNEFGEVTSQELRLKLEGFTTSDSIFVTTTNRVYLTWLSHFKSEYASIGGTTHSKYVTKKINFARPSEMLRIMFAAVIPNDADVEIYYKTGAGVSGDFIASRYYKVTPSSYTKSENEFTEVTANIENLEPFDSVMVKLVMKSINKGKIPRIKDFRVIAVA
jgi:hypothetical protein